MDRITDFFSEEDLADLPHLSRQERDDVLIVARLVKKGVLARSGIVLHRKDRHIMVDFTREHRCQPGK